MALLFLPERRSVHLLYNRFFYRPDVGAAQSGQSAVLQIADRSLVACLLSAKLEIAGDVINMEACRSLQLLHFLLLLVFAATAPTTPTQSKRNQLISDQLLLESVIFCF